MAGNDNTQITKIDKLEVAIYETINNLPTTLEANEQLCANSRKLREGSLLMGALALWNIGENGMFLQAGFKNIGQYISERGEKLGFDAKSKSAAYVYLNIAEAFRRHQDALYKAGFKPEKDASKLRMFQAAVDNHGLSKAIKQLPKMSYREYLSWAKGDEDGQRIVEEATGEELIDVTDRGFISRGDGKVIVSRKKVEEIIERGEMPTVIGCRDGNEARQLGRLLKKMRAEKAEE